MNFLKYVFVLFLALTFAACGGGGGNASTPASPASPTVVAAIPASVEVLTSASSLLSAGSEVVVTAFIKNSANVGMAGQAVTFSTSSGTLQSPSSSTDANGAVTAKLIAGSDKSVRDIAVSVTAGLVTGKVIIPVSGTRLSIAGSGALQAGGAAVSYTVRAVDSSGNAIGSADISVVSSLGNSVSSATPLRTDSTGAATFLYTPNKSGADTLTATGLGTSATTTVVISAIDFVALSPANNTDIAIGANQTITVRYKNAGSPVVGTAVAFSTTRGTISPSTVTDVNGDATAVLSSTTAGPAMVVAQIAAVGTVNLPLQFVATTPSSIVVQANPGSVLPNITGSTNQSTIQAVVRDVNGNAVANRQVNFTVIQDLSNGSLSPGNALTDANGEAQVQFIPGATSTPANGVTIKAEVASTAINATSSLTVNGKALFITIGFGNTISDLDTTTYSKTFSVYVTDANGVAVGTQQVSLSVIPEEYFKGTLTFDPILKFWKYSSIPTVCVNEDLNLNGILDAVEDTNGNGVLTPGNVTVVAPGSVTTDTFGRATFALQYGKQFAPWAKVRLTARSTVTGTESRQSILFNLVGSDTDFASTSGPAGVTSPFGFSTLCSNSN